MTVRLVAVLMALSAANVGAQDLPDRRTIDVVNLRDIQEAQRPEGAEPPEPPSGANAWSLRVITTGGFTGMGVGSVTVSSDGQLACGPAPCATPVAASLVQPVATTIASVVAVEGAWIRRPPSGLCSDCIQTTLVLKRRDGDVVRVYRASWDDSQPVTPQLRELRRLALELRAARAPR